MTRRIYRLDPKRLEPFLNPDDIIDRVRAIAKRDDLEPEQAEAVNQFILEYDIRKEGKNPNEEIRRNNRNRLCLLIITHNLITFSGFASLYLTYHRLRASSRSRTLNSPMPGPRPGGGAAGGRRRC